MKRFLWLLLVATVPAAACAAAGADQPRTITITIHHSQFDPGGIAARTGETVRFVIRNTDPIDHEFILGDQGVQIRHENGTEPYHPPRPGEVTIGAGQVAETTFTFGDPNVPVTYACHLPGHLAFGMQGAVRISR